MADWAKLNHYLIIEIAERLPSMESYECFGRVCKSWQAAANKGHLKEKTFEGPRLMLAQKDEDTEVVEREFFSVCLERQKTSKIFLPEATRKRCVSCKDWLLITSLDEIDASLVHPLSRAQIHLPKLNNSSFYRPTEIAHYIDRMVLSANPAATSDFIVMVICSNYYRLAFWKSGDTFWTPIDIWDLDHIDDLIYCNNMLYGLDRSGRIVVSDIHGPNPTQLVQVCDNFPKEICNRKLYLVEYSEGKFLIISRNYDVQLEYFCTTRFKVFEVNTEDGTCVEVKDLGNKALFLGYNTSFSIECSEYNKCKPNCIYFSDDATDFHLAPQKDESRGGGKDTGIYCLSDGSLRIISEDIGRSMFTPPTFIGPSFI